MEERRRAEHERKLAELARAGIIMDSGPDDRAKKEDLLSALRTGQPVREPWQEGLEKITMKVRDRRALIDALSLDLWATWKSGESGALPSPRGSQLGTCGRRSWRRLR